MTTLNYTRTLKVQIVINRVDIEKICQIATEKQSPEILDLCFQDEDASLSPISISETLTGKPITSISDLHAAKSPSQVDAQHATELPPSTHAQQATELPPSIDAQHDTKLSPANDAQHGTELNAIPVDDECPGSNGTGQNSDGNGFPLIYRLNMFCQDSRLEPTLIYTITKVHGAPSN